MSTTASSHHCCENCLFLLVSKCVYVFNGFIDKYKKFFKMFKLTTEINYKKNGKYVSSFFVCRLLCVKVERGPFFGSFLKRVEINWFDSVFVFFFLLKPIYFLFDFYVNQLYPQSWWDLIMLFIVVFFYSSCVWQHWACESERERKPIQDLKFCM